MHHSIQTDYGPIRGNERDNCYEYLGIRFARAGRFEYPTLIDRASQSSTTADAPTGTSSGTETEYDATDYGPSCPQSRQYFEHLEIPERMFYHREFREGITYEYNEDCLNLNIYTPKGGETGCPVILFFYGGGFDSGSCKDSSFDGEAYAKRGAILVTANYRVGVLGYITHEEIFKEYGHDGNFGLYDQLAAINWVRKHIEGFGGDPENITLMGQSAGAISIQFLCLSPMAKGLFRHAVMMSGGGMFPRFALPRDYKATREYWLDFMEIAGCKTFGELKALPAEKLFTAVERIKKKRKDNTYNTMPVVDHALIPAPIPELIDHPHDIDYMITYTNNDMFAPVMAHIGNRFAGANKGYTAFFDINAPGKDGNGAFHSADLRYVFGTLQKSHRPYDEKDREISELMLDYLVSFAATGDPSAKEADLPAGIRLFGAFRPKWLRRGGRSLCISRKRIKMSVPNYIKMTWNMLTKGDPK